ncbi:hypothetical protein V6N13_113617 [Hibiscus sabdariffa]
MADRHQHPSVMQKVAGQLHLGSGLSLDRDIRYRRGGFQTPVLSHRCFHSSVSYNAALLRPMTHARKANYDLSLVCSSSSPVCVQAPSEKGISSFAIDFLMGGVSAAVSKTAAAPIERVKLLIQNQDEMIRAGRLAEPYRGIGDCFKRTIQEEGMMSLWRGNTANVIRYFPTQVGRTVMATGNGLLATWLLVVQLVPLPFSLSIPSIMPELVLLNDAKAAKKGGERQFNGLVDVYRKTLKSDGIAGLYRGFNISCVGIIVYRGLYFGMYDSLKPVLLVGSLQDSFFASFGLGWVITNGAGLASYPIDTVRRRMMMTSGEAVKYKSSLDAFSQILKKEGAKSLFKGAGANILRAVAGAGVLAGYDKLQMIVFGKKYGSGGA